MAKKMKLNGEGSKNNQKAKGTKKIRKFLKKIVIGGIIVFVSFNVVQKGVQIYNEKRDLEIANMTLPTTAYNFSITYQESDYEDPILLLGNVDLGYFYVMEGEQNELVRTSPHDALMHYAYDNSVIEGINPGSKEVIALYKAEIMEDIVENGDVESEFSITGNNYTITIEKNVLDELLEIENCNELLECYTLGEGEDAITYQNLGDYLDAVIQNRNELQSSKSK